MTSRYIPRALVRRVRLRAHDLCEYCRLPQFSQEATFHVDHIKPLAAGGATTVDNLALACVTCSLRKAARQYVPDPRSGKLVPIFHPRKQRWSDHFAWTRSQRLHGKTATGRATIVTLGMNRSALVAIRQQLTTFGNFPSKEPMSDE